MMPTNAIEILPSPAVGAVRAPSSKSYANRALLLASLAAGESLIRQPLHSDDTIAMSTALRNLGVEIDETDDAWRVRSTGRLTPQTNSIDCRDSGTTLRFLLSAAALGDTPIRLTGSRQLLNRPLTPLLDALSARGVSVSTGDPSGIDVRGPLMPGPARVDCSVSSQYASSLIMAMGATGDPSASVLVENLVSEPYVAMTLQSMAVFGVQWTASETAANLYIPAPGARYRATDSAIEFDASSAGHLFAVIALSGGTASVLGARRSTAQPDIRILALLERMGCAVSESESGVTLGAGTLSAPGEVDMRDWPDMLTTVAVLAAFAEGDTVIRNVSHARGHETDRIAATARELTKMGVPVVETDDGLRVTGCLPRAAVIDTHDDHRMAMAFAAAACAVPGVVISHPACVRKTYPAFWDDLPGLGITWKEVT